MKLPIIQALWIGAPLSNLEKLCVQSFLDHGHQFHLYTYDQVDGVPSGATIKDANEILPESEIYTAHHGSYASFSDYFRWELLAKHGGIWVDMDMACIRPLDFAEKTILARGARGEHSPAILAFPKGHEFACALAKHCRETPNKSKTIYGGVGGPVVLTQFVKQHNMQPHAKSHDYFLPVTNTYWYTAFDDTFANCPTLFPTTYTVHFFNEALRRIGLDKNARFDSQSLFEQLKAKHRIANLPNAKTITTEQLHQMTYEAFESRRTKHKRRIKRERTLFILFALAVGIYLGHLIG